MRYDPELACISARGMEGFLHDVRFIYAPLILQTRDTTFTSDL